MKPLVAIDGVLDNLFLVLSIISAEVAGSLPFTILMDSCGASFQVILLRARWGLYERLWAC